MIRVHDDVANNACSSAVARANTGSTFAGATLQLWEGALPDALADTPAGILLADIILSNPAFDTPGTGGNPAGVASIAGLPKSANALATGFIGFARMLDRDGTPVWDESSIGNAGTAIIVSNMETTSGLAVTIIQYRFRVTPPSAV
jgi:hypothetical protein